MQGILPRWALIAFLALLAAAGFGAWYMDTNGPEPPRTVASIQSSDDSGVYVSMDDVGYDTNDYLVRAQALVLENPPSSPSFQDYAYIERREEGLVLWIPYGQRSSPIGAEDLGDYERVASASTY